MEVLYKPTWCLCWKTPRYHLSMGLMKRTGPPPSTGSTSSSGGSLSLERFSVVLEQVLAAVSQTDLEEVMLALPSLVRLTPASHRLGQPLVLQADGDLTLGSGWQLAADTTISVAFGTARLDLTATSWDANLINFVWRPGRARRRLSFPKVWSCRCSEGL